MRKIKCPKCMCRRPVEFTLDRRTHIKGLLVFTGSAVCSHCAHSWQAVITEPCQHPNPHQTFLWSRGAGHQSEFNYYEYKCRDCKKVWEDGLWEDY